MNQNYIVDNQLKLKKKFVSGLNCNRSVSLNHLNMKYIENNYKDKYFNLKEQHEETKKNLNNQQNQLKQLNYRLQRILQEKKNFLSQFISMSQVKTENLLQELEINNSFLHKENEKLKNQLLLQKFETPQNSKNNYGKIMIINMKQDIKTNYDWVKARIDSGLNNQTKRNPKNGQLFRQIKKKNNLFQKNQERKIKLGQQRQTMNKERHRVSFCNQLKKEKLNQENLELNEKRLDFSHSCCHSNKINESDEDDYKSEKTLNKKQYDNFSESSDSSIYKNYYLDKNKPKYNNLLLKFENNTNENSDQDEYLSNKDHNFEIAKQEIEKLKEIIFLQSSFIEKSQKLSKAKKTDIQNIQEKNIFNKSFSSISSLEMNDKSDDQYLKIKNEEIFKSTHLDFFTDQNTKNKLTSKYSLKQIENIETVSNNSIDENNLDSLNSSLENYSLSESIIKNNDSVNDNFLTEKSLSFHELVNSKKQNKEAFLKEKLEIQKINNHQIKIKYKARLKELEQNLNDLKTENEILRSSLEKCIQDCLKEIGGC